MKKYIFWLGSAILLIAIIIAVVCFASKKDNFVPKLEITASDVSMFIDDSPKMLDYKIFCNEQYSVSFSASSDIIFVNENGEISANKVGSCTLTITAVSKSLSKSKDISVTITQKEVFVPNLEIIAPSVLEMYNDDAPKSIEYSVESNENYTTQFSVNSDILSVSNDGIITPNKVGSCTITILVKSENLTKSKEIIVTIKNSQQLVNLSIKNVDYSPVTNIFANNKYILEIEYSKNLNYEYTVKKSENISEFNIIKTENSKIFYYFTPTNSGEIFFEFCYKDYSKKISQNVYKYLTNIDIEFSRSLENNIIKIYLFNKNYEQNANENNVFSDIYFTIKNQENAINNYSINIENENIAILENNKIIANNIGETYLIISANDGSKLTEKYKIIVENIYINSLAFSKENITLEVYESYTYEITYSPIYAFTNFEYYLNDEAYNFSTISFNTAGTYTLKVLEKYTNKTAFLNISVAVKYKFLMSSLLEYYDATLENDILTITATQDETYVYFTYLVDGSTSTKSTITYTHEETLSVQNFEESGNRVTLALTGKGTLFLHFTHQNFPFSTHTLTIIIN